MTTRHVSWDPRLSPARQPRHAAAAALQATGRLLTRMARRLAWRQPGRRGDPVYEFYAESGAPEGALYLDGELVGYVDGIRRL